ncbi:hypothetical protein GCM10010304_63200 [Streptomyces roseoviolaceus]
MANRALPLIRTTGYDLAKRGRYPCTVLRLGNASRVVTADLLKLLHIDVCAAVLVGVRGVSEEHARGPSSRMCDLDKPCHHGVAKQLCRPVHRIAKGRGRKGSADACGQCNTAYELLSMCGWRRRR